MKGGFVPEEGEGEEKGEKKKKSDWAGKREKAHA
jgi:hypothetical protein